MSAYDELWVGGRGSSTGLQSLRESQRGLLLRNDFASYRCTLAGSLRSFTFLDRNALARYVWFLLLASLTDYNHGNADLWYEHSSTEQAWDLYGLPETAQRSLRGDIITGKPSVLIEGERYTLPNGVHKPWWYHSNELLLSEPMVNACPFMQYIFTPDMSRWEETTEDAAQWVGIGK